MESNNSTDIASYFQLSKNERAFCCLIRVVLNTGVGGVICCVGIFENILAYIVLDKDTPASASFLLRSLALTDVVFLLMWLINFSMKDLFRYLEIYSPVWSYVKLSSYPVVYIAQMATIWMTVLIAAARFTAVCTPTWCRRFCTLANIKLSVMFLYLIIISYNLPRFFEVRIEIRNGTVWFVDTALGSDTSYQFIYNEVLYYISTFGLPLLLLIVLNFKLTLAYNTWKKKRQQRPVYRPSSRNEQDEANMTLVMIVVVAVFVVCQLPGRLAQIIWKYKYGSCKTMPFFVMELATIMEVVNSGINFWVYYLIRPAFRKNLPLTITMWKKIPQEP